MYNVEKLLTPTTSERVASRVINRCKDDSVLSTLGCRKKSIASAPNKKRLFTTDDMRVIRKSADLSSRQTISIMEDLNRAAGHTVFETGAKQKMCEKNHSLDCFFDRMKIQFVRNVAGSKKTENFDQHVVVTNDIPTFIDKVLEVRSLDRSKCLVKVGMDGGGGFFKICLSIFNLMMRDDESKGVRGLGKKFVDSGVKKFFIITIAPKTPENFFNLEKLWVVSGIDTLTWDYSILVAQSRPI